MDCISPMTESIVDGCAPETSAASAGSAGEETEGFGEAPLDMAGLRDGEQYTLPKAGDCEELRGRDASGVPA